MKLYTKFLTLAAASTVYCYSFSVGGISLNENTIGIFKRDNTFNVNPECQKEIDTVEEFKCLGANDSLNLESAKTLCPFILSDKCKKFYENPTSYLPNCKNEEDFKALSSPEAVKFILKVREMECSTDGEGNMCPAAEVNLKKGSINESTVMASCKSKKCSTALEGFLDVMNNELKTAVEEQNIGNKHGDESISIYLKGLLKSKACTSLTKDGLNTNTDAKPDAIDATDAINATNATDTTNDTDAKPNATGNVTSGTSTNMSKLYSSLILAIAATVFYF